VFDCFGSSGRGRKCLWFAITLGSLSPALFAQQQLDREITFVRALAKEMRFIELAKSEAERLATEFRGAGEQDKIAQLSVEVTYYGARSRSDRNQQRTLFKETIDKSKELVERSSDAATQLEARATLANASQDFGQFLVEELEIARSDAPERVKELEEESTTVFRAGIESCGKVMDVLKEQRKDPAKETEYFLMWMKKAVLTREQGRADKTNRSVLTQRAIEELTELVLEVGEETAIGLRGLFEIAQCQEVDGKIAEAIDSYRGTINQIATSLEQAQKGELELSGELQGFLFEMMQEVYVRTGEVMVREGQAGTAELFAEFRANMTKFGEKGLDLFDVVSDQHGHLMLLAESKFLAESGDPKKVADAMTMVQRINDKHPGDYVGVRAKAVLRDILGVQQNLVSGNLLFEVAKGELQNKNYEAAIKGLRKAIAAMSADEQAKLGLEAHQMLGTAYGITDRYLESIIALGEGIRRHGKKDDGPTSDAADSLDRAISAHKRLVKNDAAFTTFYAGPLELVKDYSVGGGAKLFWKQANDLFNAKKYPEAIKEYRQVDKGFQLYERAQVLIARCQAAIGDLAAARQSIADYRAFAATTEIPARETARQQVRAAAMAEAEFTEMQMAYLEARGSEELKLKKDLTKYDAAIERAQAFATNAKDGDTNLATALEYLGRLNAEKGDLERAEGAYTQLKAKDPVRASRLATEVFKEYQTKVKTLKDELDQAIAKDLGEAEVQKALAATNAMRGKLVALGLDYITSSPKPQLAILVGTMQNCESLGDWKRVDEVAQKSIELYGTDTTEATKKTIDMIVRPKVGEALLQQQRFQEAYDMLVAAEKVNPTQWELKRQIARALGGWFEFNPQTGAPVKVPGLDRPAEAYQKYYGDPKESYRIWASRPEVKQFSLEWYRFQWETYWFARQAGQKDGKFKEIADKFYRTARSTDDFASLKKHGAEGLELFNFFRANR
jgi:tetratricopeptide (TPR) repeat protein